MPRHRVSPLASPTTGSGGASSMPLRSCKSRPFPNTGSSAFADDDSGGGPFMNANLAALLYLVAGVLFILSLRGLSSPASPRQGNFPGMAGMAIAVPPTLAAHPPADGVGWVLVVLGVAIGGSIGAGTAGAGRRPSRPVLAAWFDTL